MNAAVDDKMLRLRELLLSDFGVNIDENGELVIEHYETKCECYGYVLGNAEKDGFFSRYESCPKSAYIQYVTNLRRVPPVLVL